MSSEYIQSLLGDPDGYWKLSGSDRAEFVTAVLPGHLQKQRHLLHETSDPTAALVCQSAMELVEPLTDIFVRQHDPTRWKKSWRRINGDVCKQLESRVSVVEEYLSEFDIYLQVMQYLRCAIDAEDVETNTQVSNALRTLAVPMAQLHLPILLLTLDNYFTGSEEMEHLEPDLKVILQSAEHTSLAMAAHAEYDQLGGKSVSGEVTPIIGDLKVWGGWMAASLSCGDNILENLYILLPQHYKYYEQVMAVARTFHVSMTGDDAERCMVRLFTGHEYGHGVFGPEEFATDRVAIPTSLSLARKVSDEELRRQIIFTLVESSVALRTKSQHAFERGYEVSSIAVLNTFIEQGLFSYKHAMWNIRTDRSEQTIANMLALPPNPEPIHPTLHTRAHDLLKNINS
ncbi:MAG TPA: hypothetical protein VJ246_02625 [Patescibacteria group bacterium]|nr:hypothetical protein [Patescibacteria group bacterium]